MERLRLGLMCAAFLAVTACHINANAQAIPGLSNSMKERMPNSPMPLNLIFVPTRDNIYTPVTLRKPQGDGPFPAILFLVGNGGGGMPAARRAMRRSGYTMNRFLLRGYVVVYLRYRMELPQAYRTAEPLRVAGNTQSRAPLTHDDVISTVEYIQNLPYVDGNRIGMIGVSQGGELIMKIASEINVGAAVCAEPASLEYLGVTIAKPSAREAQFQDKEQVRKMANREEAMARIERTNTPMLIIGRDGDHLQGLFELSYEWFKEAGKDVEWVSYNHPEHGFIFPDLNSSGKYSLDDIQFTAIGRIMDYFEEKL